MLGKRIFLSFYEIFQNIPFGTRTVNIFDELLEKYVTIKYKLKMLKQKNIKIKDRLPLFLYDMVDTSNKSMKYRFIITSCIVKLTTRNCQ